MRFGIGFLLALLATVGVDDAGSGRAHVALAQAPDANQTLLAELKGIRATLDRLVQLAESSETNQRAELAMQQVQAFDGRMRTLQAQRSQLAAREAELSRMVETLSDPVSGGIGPNGMPTAETPDNAQRSAMNRQLTTATESLQAIRARQQALQNEIAVLQDRIARLDKLVEERVGR